MVSLSFVSRAWNVRGEATEETIPMSNQGRKLTQRTIERAQPGAARFYINDADIKGFRLAVFPSGRKIFYFRYRVGGGRGAAQREAKIGEHPSMKAEAARRIAAEWMADVAKGGDPAGERRARRVAPRMGECFDRYLREHARPHKKPASVANDERLIEKRLRPALERHKVAELKRAQVADLHRALAKTPYEANRALALLSKCLNLAEVWGWRPDGSNPCRHVKKFREDMRKRFLSPAELAALGQALRCAEAGEIGVVSSYAIAAIRLLMFTGARKGEILGLQWNWIDWEKGRASLPDSKTGAKTLILSPPALAILQSLPRVDGNPHVLPGGKPGEHLVNPDKTWRLIREAAGLGDVRLHDLRHTYASVGAGGGLSLAIIGALLGHTQAQTTARYAHLADDPLRVAAASIGERIAAALEGNEGVVVPLAGTPKNGG